MVVYSMFLSLMMLLTVGGQASDLLDLMPTQSYWQAKHVVVSPDAMLHELESPKAGDVGKTIDDLGSPDSTVRDAAAAKLLQAGDAAVTALTDAEKSPDPNIASSATDILQRIAEKDVPGNVRRLMAIRTLGEMKDAKSLPTLKTLLDSKRRFESDYAQEAINHINGQPTSRPTLDPAVRKQDLALLPAGSVVAGQLSRRGEHDTIDAILKTSFADEKERQDAADTITESILPLVDKIGNVRIDGASVGVTFSNEGVPSSAVAIFHGIYNAALARGQFPKDKMKDVGGTLAFSDDNACVVAASDDRLIVIAGEHLDDAIIQKVVANMNTPATPKQLADLAAQQKGVDTNQAAWLRMVLPPALAQHAPPAVQHTNEFILTADYTAAGANLQMVANCNSADDAKALMGLIRVGIGQLKVEIVKQMQQERAQAKGFEAWQTFLGNMKMEVKDKSLIVSDVFTPDLLNQALTQAIKTVQMMKQWQKQAEQQNVPGQPPVNQVQPVPAGPN